MSLTLSHITASLPSKPSPKPKPQRTTLTLSVQLNPLPPASTSGKLRRKFTELASSSVFFLGLSAASAAAAFAQPPPVSAPKNAAVMVEQTHEGDVAEGKYEGKIENSEDKELEARFETWKSKTYALTVPLRIIALCGSIPPLWGKDFIKSQGKRAKLLSTFRESLEGIFSDLCTTLEKGNIKSTSALAADMVTIGDSWLNFAISKGLIEPLQGVEDQEWFNGLSEKWKDWADLWRPELAGRISMIDAPREVVGMVLKYMGASCNTKNIDLEVAGGMTAVQKNLALLAKQVRLFDSTHYLKAFGVGDVWVAVGWSSDVLPDVKRMSNVAVIVPKSGASLWADLWAIPAASKVQTSRIGGRVRGPSPLIHQWLEFCLQPARALPFKQEVVPGASSFSLENIIPEEEPKVLKSSNGKLETNLISGVPPPEILGRCEFLEPLCDVALSDYQRLIASIQKQHSNLLQKVQDLILQL